MQGGFGVVIDAEGIWGCSQCRGDLGLLLMQGGFGVMQMGFGVVIDADGIWGDAEGIFGATVGIWGAVRSAVGQEEVNIKVPKCWMAVGLPGGVRISVGMS